MSPISSDDLQIHTAGADKLLAGKDVSGVYHEAVVNETLNASGVPTYTSPSNPLPVTMDAGQLLNRIEALEILLSRLLSGAGQQTPDPAGRTRVSVDWFSTTAVLAEVTRVRNAGVGNVDQGPATVAMQNLPALLLRDRIVVT